ncbi:MAG: type 1 periplasmic binding fold superfamily protein [Saprospiraceae bacterium]|nr:type 1 periplasmic binding fold superfamily protein [Saprospiraceae bacterium]
MNKLNGYILLLGAGLMLLVSCKDDVKPVNEEEVINEVTIRLKDDHNREYNLEYRDADGSGPGVPVIKSDTLPTNTNLQGNISLLNTLVSPTEDITAEVSEEGTAHQFFYVFTDSPAPVIQYADMDADGYPIGIEIQCNTGDAYDGSLRVVLRHQPNKKGTGVATGDMTQAGGSTDVDILLPIVVR